MIAKVAVSSVTYGIDRGYDYLVPSDLENQVQIGKRVMIPFGKGNRQTEAIILQLIEKSSFAKLKTIISVLDSAPVLDEEGIRLARFIRSRCFCTFYDAIKTMLPNALWYREITVWKRTRQSLPENLTGEETNLLGLFDDADDEVSEDLVKKQFPDSFQQTLHKLKNKGLLEERKEYKRRSREKEQYQYYLCSDSAFLETYLSARKRGSKQLQIISFLMENPGSYAEEIFTATGAGSGTLKSLEAAEVVTKTADRRVPATDFEVGDLNGYSLTEDQNAVYEQLRKQMLSGEASCALLHGITGSGKTSVYLKLIHECLISGKTAMVLVPEIGLTPQVRTLFQTHFGNMVAVLHSALSEGEKLEIWKEIQSGKIRVVIGTRSAVFSPLHNLGILVIDEEQEHTYKSENAPTYHAREIARYRTFRDNGLLLLCSATPSVESRYFAESGEYRYYRLNRRFNERPLPQVTIVDSGKDLRSGIQTTIGPVLRDEIAKNLELHQKTMIYINRRGTSSSVQCVECGYVPECQNCSTHLAYHGNVHRYICHHCGYNVPAFSKCPECGGTMRKVGVGTQQVVEDLNRLFPDTRILRMDSDSTSTKNAHENILRRFQNEDIPILVGTQMITKGLNIDDVTLIGILNADHSLYIDDYRAGERTFSVITQAIGRAGRGMLHGRAVLQTYAPNHPIIRYAAEQDYDGFYQSEIKIREAAGMPPFSDYFYFNVFGENEEKVLQACMRLKKTCDQEIHHDPAFEKVRILGPAPDFLSKQNNIYHYHVTVSGKADHPLRDLCSRILISFRKDSANSGVNLSIVQNPEN